MAERYLIDSNVIIDYTALRLPPNGSLFAEQLFDTDFITSIAVKIEVLGFNDVPAKIKAMEEFVDTAIVLPLNEPVVGKTIGLRRQYSKLKLGDAIIAATALMHGLTLFTRNVADFSSIPGLRISNPWDM
jgi:predicted nucleic acid-binding protein